MNVGSHTGTLTFLFTDIEGSTKLWEHSPAAMKVALARHDAILRGTIEENAGSVFSTAGDAFCAAFPTASLALAAARAAQVALTQEPWPEPARIKVRMALHTGAVELRDDDYFGPPLNRAARLLSAGHGGQVLLSLVTQELVRDSFPVGVTLRDVGERCLKELIRPERGYQMVARELPADFPPLKTLDARAHNLPIQLTSFVGRDQEMQEVKTLLRSSRLVTLAGSGGSGKTRLALQVGADRIDDFADGVWFIELASLGDARVVPQAVAAVLGIKEQPGEELTATLKRELKNKELLLLVDNCEHLVEASARVCQALLASCARVGILATSRQALRIPGEKIYPILPLPLPRKGDDVQPLLRSPAVQLFVDRAKSHKPSFELNAREAPAVAALVTRLEGIPLALELAAARVRSLSVADINTRLKDRYKLLTGGARVHDERQQTLRALVDWSYELLTESEQTALARFSVFAGGFDMPAAEMVCSADPLLADDVLGLIESLIEKSLVMLDDRDEGMRYRMLETIRDYAREKLEQSGELDATLARHCDYYLAMATAANQGLEGPEQADWVWRVEAELDNLRVAVALALAGGVDGIVAVKFAVALAGFWILRGYSTEGRSVVRAALELPAVQASDVGRAWALYTGSRLAESQGDLAEALKMLEICLELRRGLGNPVDIAATLSTLSLVRLQTGNVVGAEVGEREALQIFVALGDRVGEAIGLLHLGQVAIYRGELDVGRTLLEQCLSIARDIKSLDTEGECELHLGEAAVDGGVPDRASQHFKRSLIVCSKSGDKTGEAIALWHLGQLDLGNGNLASARARLREALQSFNAFGMRAELLGCLENCAGFAKAENRLATAARLVGAIELARERLSLARPPKAEERWSTQIAALRKSLRADEFDASRSEGRQWQIDDALRHVLSAQTPLNILV